MREKDIETWLREQVKKMGGKFFKFTSPGNDGVPDRIAILPGGAIWFIELKTDKGTTKKIQDWQIDQLRRLGCNVRVVRGMEAAKAWLQEVKP